MKVSYLALFYCVLSALLVDDLAFNKAYAWEPCLPFCDRNCSGRAAQGLGTAISGQIQGLAGRCNQLTAETINSTEQFVDLVVNYGSTLIENQFSVLRALDSSVTRLSLSSDINMGYLASASDLITSTYKEILSQLTEREMVIHNQRTLGVATKYIPPPLLDLPCEGCSGDFISAFTNQLTNARSHQQILLDIGDEHVNRPIGVKYKKDDLDAITEYQLHIFDSERLDASHIMRLSLLSDNSEKANTVFTRLHHVIQAKNIDQKAPKHPYGVDGLLAGVDLSTLNSLKQNNQLAVSNEHETLLRSIYQLQLKNAKLMALLENQQRATITQVIK
jgi:hypothetical protein